MNEPIQNNLLKTYNYIYRSLPLSVKRQKRTDNLPLKRQPSHKQCIWFLLTHKTDPENPKEFNLSHRTQKTKKTVCFRQIRQNNYNNMKTFGEYIRRLREDNGLPLRKVAAALDIDTSILNKIEKNERRATIEMIPILAESLDKAEKEVELQFLLKVIHDALEDLLYTQNLTVKNIDRIELFKDIVKQNYFSRQDYLRHNKEISTGTASRALKDSVDKEILEKIGDKRLTKYKFL